VDDLRHDARGPGPRGFRSWSIRLPLPCAAWGRAGEGVPTIGALSSGPPPQPSPTLRVKAGVSARRTRCAGAPRPSPSPDR
jgi:hypothetical protein